MWGFIDIDVARTKVTTINSYLMLFNFEYCKRNFFLNSYYDGVGCQSGQFNKSTNPITRKNSWFH